MEKRVLFVLVCVLIGALLVACEPSQAELDAQATKVAADIFATQTAEAPTRTPTPTLTPTPMPTVTPTNIPTATSIPPTATPTLVPPTATPTPSEVRTVSIPEEFKTVAFSQDGDHVAFGVEQNGKMRIIVDGQEETLFDNVTVVEFSPKGNHYYYGGKRDGKWFLIRDGKEIAELGGLTSLTQGTGLHFLGGKVTVTMWSTLAIWFADESEDYFVLCYPDNTGKILKDGSWLPVEFHSFWHEGMAFSPDGQHYSFAVSTVGSSSARMHIDGVSGPQFDSIDGATYLQPGNQLIYRGKRDDVWTLMVSDRPLQGYGSLAGIIVVSPDRLHLAALVKKEAGKQAVVIDGREELAFSKVDWGYTGFLSSPGSFTWSRDGLSHAYVAYLTNGEASPMVVVHNGRPLGAHSEIRGSSLSLSNDGKHVAYVAKDNDRWAVVVDGVAQESFEDVGTPIFLGTGDEVAYATKTPEGWIIKGLFESAAFLEVGPLVAGPEGRIAYTAKLQGDKWQVFLNTKPISEPFDGIVAQIGISFVDSDSVHFLARDGGKLLWVTGR